MVNQLFFFGITFFIGIYGSMKNLKHCTQGSLQQKKTVFRLLKCSLKELYFKNSLQKDSWWNPNSFLIGFKWSNF